MSINIHDFKRDSARALKNENLQKALRYTTDRFRERRKSAVAELRNWEDLKSQAREIKEKAISNLDEYLKLLEENILKCGGTVHWAKDGDEANKIILGIASEGRVKSVVKSKSMATEEIELNQALEKAGIETVETDLGEYIIQLANEKPSHIIAPAIHKSKEDISELFSQKLNIPYYSEPEDLTKIAREKLRQRFLMADMGVSGANLAVAETGTIVIVENEGNARLTTTLPRVHVALMGIEKIIPRFEDLAVFLSILARSATGQKMSSYVSLITGPRRKGDRDGPEEFHLVLLDNGRSDILAADETRESLYCIRCGACLNICPVYRKVGGHSYGWVYSGPIGAIISPQLLGIDRLPDLPFASSLCGACKDVCPLKIDIPRVLLELRKRVIEKKIGHDRVGTGKLEGLAIKIWRFVMEHPWAYSYLLTLAYYGQRLFIGQNGEKKSLLFPFSKWSKSREFPTISKKTFRERWKEQRGN